MVLATTKRAIQSTSVPLVLHRVDFAQSTGYLEAGDSSELDHEDEEEEKLYFGDPCGGHDCGVVERSRR